MTEASANKPPTRGRLSPMATALLGCTALLVLLGSGAWEFRMPKLRSYRFTGLGRGHRWAGGDGAEPAAVAAAAATACELDVEQGPIAEACHLLNDVCVDQVRSSWGRWEGGGGRSGDAWTARQQTDASPPAGTLVLYPTHVAAIKLFAVKLS